MRVKLLISRAGPGGVWGAGDEIEVSDQEAKRLMEANPPKAVPVREDRSVETADAAPKRKARAPKRAAGEADE